MVNGEWMAWPSVASLTTHHSPLTTHHSPFTRLPLTIHHLRGRRSMAAQSGKDMLVKLDQTGSGSFLTVAGLRRRALALNAAAIDITDAESAGRWRELLSG